MTSSPTPATESNKDWSVKYQVFKDPTSMSSRTVCLNYSNVFTEEEVKACADKAMASHSEAVPNSLIIERVDSDSSSDEAIQQLYDEVFYPVLEDKDWLRKMTSESEEPPASRKRTIPPASSAPHSKRASLRKYDKEKEQEQEPFDLQDEFAADADMDCGHRSSSSSEEEDSTSPKPSTSKSSKKSSLTPKQRFKGKVFQVTDICLLDTTVASASTNVSEHPYIASPYHFGQDNQLQWNTICLYSCTHDFSILLCSIRAPTAANRIERGS